MWTVEEDLCILQLIEQHGKCWSKIASHLPGRSDNGVRNRWNRMEKAQTIRKRHGSEQGYRCRKCGQMKRGHICAALTRGARPSGEDLEQKAAALTALRVQTMQSMLSDSKLSRKPPLALPPSASTAASTASEASAAHPPEPPAALGAVEPFAATPFAPPQALPALTVSVPPADSPPPSFDEAQLDRFLTELKLNASSPAQAVEGAPLSLDEAQLDLFLTDLIQPFRPPISPSSFYSPAHSPVQGVLPLSRDVAFSLPGGSMPLAC